MEIRFESGQEFKIFAIFEKYAKPEIYFLRQKLQPDYWWEVSRNQAASIHKYLRMNLDLDFNYGDDDDGDSFDDDFESDTLCSAFFAHG